MNIGLILPVKPKEKQNTHAFSRLGQALGSLIFNRLPLETQSIELAEGLSLMVCTIPTGPEIMSHEGIRKKLKLKLDKLFEKERVWPVLEHPEFNGFYNPHVYRFDEAIKEVAVNGFPEVLKLIQGIGDLSTKEITVTGGSAHLEYAIARLITKVKSMNLLLPDGSCEPGEAEQAFMETGIPVHITSDGEVLNRTTVWLRFPDDDESFDMLPVIFQGIIIDFGTMKIIDTKNRKIFNITLEFSDKIKRRIGQSNLDLWEAGVLEGVVIMVCANAWDVSVTEASTRLGMRLSFNS